MLKNLIEVSIKETQGYSEMANVPAYLAEHILPDTTEPHKIIMRDTSPFICAEGPARTSKTFRCLRKILSLCITVPKMRVCIVRSNAVDLDNTIRRDLREEMLRFGFSDPESQIRQHGGETKFKNLYFPNTGSEIVLGGMSRPGSVMGAKYQLIYMNELRLFEEKHYAALKTRFSGNAWKRKDGTIINQFIACTNPDVPTHWMYNLEKEGLAKFIKFGFKDNAAYYREGRWSHEGIATVENLSALPKFQRDRFFLGLRVAPHGIVFDLQDVNVIDNLPDLSNCIFYRAADWGMKHPSIVLWIAEDPETDNIYVIREWRKTHSDIDEVSDAMIAFSDGNEIEKTIIDREELRLKELKKRGIQAQMATKGPGSVIDGVFLIQAALKRAQDGLDGGLYIYRDLLCNSDNHEDAKLCPDDIIDEFGKLHFAEKGDKPEDEGDDAIDALRYFYLWHSQKPHINLTPFSSIKSIPKERW